MNNPVESDGRGRGRDGGQTDGGREGNGVHAYPGDGVAASTHFAEQS